MYSTSFSRSSVIVPSTLRSGTAPFGIMRELDGRAAHARSASGAATRGAGSDSRPGAGAVVVGAAAPAGARAAGVEAVYNKASRQGQMNEALAKDKLVSDHCSTA